MGLDSANQIRLGGSDRYATAAIVAQNMIGGLQSPSVAIATGENFPDALSIASIAGQLKMPVLLTEKSQVPQETLNTLQAMKPSQVYLIGGEGVISPSVAQEVTSALNLPGCSVTRLSGASRYNTMAAVGNAFDSDIQSLCFATGEDFPNALTGAALASHLNETLILLPSTSLDDYSDLKELITRHLAQSVIQPYLFGNVKAIPTDIEDELNSISNALIDEIPFFDGCFDKISVFCIHLKEIQRKKFLMKKTENKRMDKNEGNQSKII